MQLKFEHFAATSLMGSEESPQELTENLSLIATGKVWLLGWRSL